MLLPLYLNNLLRDRLRITVSSGKRIPLPREHRPLARELVPVDLVARPTSVATTSEVRAPRVLVGLQVRLQGAETASRVLTLRVRLGGALARLQGVQTQGRVGAPRSRPGAVSALVVGAATHGAAGTAACAVGEAVATAGTAAGGAEVSAPQWRPGEVAAWLPGIATAASVGGTSARSGPEPLEVTGGDGTRVYLGRGEGRGSVGIEYDVGAGVTVSIVGGRARLSLRLPTGAEVPLGR